MTRGSMSFSSSDSSVHRCVNVAHRWTLCPHQLQIPTFSKPTSNPSWCHMLCFPFFFFFIFMVFSCLPLSLIMFASCDSPVSRCLVCCPRFFSAVFPWSSVSFGPCLFIVWCCCWFELWVSSCHVIFRFFFFFLASSYIAHCSFVILSFNHPTGIRLWLKFLHFLTNNLLFHLTMVLLFEPKQKNGGWCPSLHLSNRLRGVFVCKCLF